MDGRGYSAKPLSAEVLHRLTVSILILNGRVCSTVWPAGGNNGGRLVFINSEILVKTIRCDSYVVGAWPTTSSVQPHLDLLPFIERPLIQKTVDEGAQQGGSMLPAWVVEEQPGA